MKKVAIVTLNGYFNYGNRLQNYALQEAIKLLGFEVETILCSRKSISQDNRTDVSKPNHSKEENAKDIFREIIDKTNEDEEKTRQRIRTEVFKDFTYKYIRETNYYISYNDIPNNLSNEYDYFVTGSDQVWNFNFNRGSSVYFLAFAERYKRISYAPSFGVSEIIPKHKENYQKWLLGIDSLSVREDDGAKIIKELTGRDVPVLVDPTLLLTKEKWLFIAKEAPSKPKDKYLLTYFLGGIPSEYKKQIKEIAKDNNLKVINLGDIKEEDTYKTGPSEFIDYVSSCSMFCTDSFHGVIFSILMEKPFIVYKRVDTSISMFSRIDTLLKKFDLNDRKIESIKTKQDIFHVDFTHVLSILEEERSKSLKYLKKALNVED